MHTLCLPVSTSITEVINGADQQAIVSILSKMGMYSQYILLISVIVRHKKDWSYCFLSKTSFVMQTK